MHTIEYTMYDNEYEDFLNEVYGDVKVAGMTYSTGFALRYLDPIAFRCGKSDYESITLSDMEDGAKFVIAIDTEGDTEWYSSGVVEVEYTGNLSQDTQAIEAAIKEFLTGDVVSVMGEVVLVDGLNQSIELGILEFKTEGVQLNT